MSGRSGWIGVVRSGESRGMMFAIVDGVGSDGGAIGC